VIRRPRATSHRRNWPMLIFSLIFLIAATSDCVLAQAPLDAAAQSATFIFSGTVDQQVPTQVGARSLNTVRVRVQQVISSPAIAGLLTGQNIVVLLADTGKMPIGTRATFFAAGWKVDSIYSVREIAHQPIAPIAPLAAAANLRNLPIRVANFALRRRADSADLVIAGDVSTVSSLPAESLSIGPGVLRPLSEHDPKWTEARIRVRQVFKGSVAVDSQVRVLFPQSKDIAWREAHKFQLNETGVYFLRRADLTVRLVPSALRQSSYTALAADDAQPIERRSHIDSVLRR
jgi:hypothetical protein